METVRLLNFIITALFFICYSYQFFYILVPFFKKDKPHAPAREHRYAVLISARNEERVIAQLIESVRGQSYDSRLVTIFVVADNCTDGTAAAAREAGALVFERFDSRNVGKGYALDFLLGRIDELYPERPFDGYFVFDADNILDERYIEEMNRTFSDGYEIVTSYRNSKNYGDNWISAGYALWFMRESRFLNHARMLLGTSCAVSGTGFLFSRETLERCGGWKFFLLTEDIEFTVKNVVDGVKIGFCPGAVFFDEQPTRFSQSWRQRKRWTRGYMQVLGKYGPALAKGAARKNFGCFDMGMAIMPAAVLSVLGLLVNIAGLSSAIGSGQGLWSLLPSAAMLLINTYLTVFVIGAVATVSEWRSIYAPTGRKILYAFTFPLFMLTYIPITFAALLDRKTGWQPIEHNRARTLADIRRNIA